MRKLCLAALLVFPLNAFASAVLIQPAAPDTHSFVTVTIGGAWPDACVPAGTDTTIQGDAITIVVHQSVSIDTGCLTLITPWQQTADIGLLPPGTYNVHALIQQDNGHVTDLGTQRLTVRPAQPFRAYPPGAPVSGGTQVRLVSSNPWPTNQVVFGDSSVVTATYYGTTLFVTAPPHAAGTVDIKVGTATATRAFTYYDPSDPPDPSIFEPVLFPIAFAGAGAYGSSWVTDNTISAPSTQAATFFELNPVTKLFRLDTTDPAGVLVHAGRGTIDSAALSSRIRDLSRQAESAGTQIPVVRESDWRLGTVRLTDIPSDPRFRTMLRIWSDHSRPYSVLVEASVKGRAQFASVEVGLTPAANGLLYAQMDLGELVARIPSADPRDVTVNALAYDPDLRLWALVSVTNNDTQQVTAIGPQ